MIVILTTIISSIIGGLTVWYIQQYYLNNKERQNDKKKNIIKPLQLEKVASASLLLDLKPTTNLQLAYEMLGSPKKIQLMDTPTFSPIAIDTNSYIYEVKNAYIKITSKNSLTIDTITVFPTDTSFVLEDFPNPFNRKKIVLNGTKVDPSLDSEWNHTVLVARRDESFVLSKYIGNSLYFTYTYFGSLPLGWRSYNMSNDNKEFIDGVIQGVCISYAMDDGFYIYDYEKR